MSGTPRDGERGWLSYDGDEPEPAEVDAGASTSRTAGPRDSAWLRHDLPEPSATGARPGATGRATDAVAGAGGRGGPADADAEEPHDTGVPPTIVRRGRGVHPSHVTGPTQPMPDDAAPAADT